MDRMPDGRKPFYEYNKLGIAFVNNPRDGPDAYDVLVGKDRTPDKRGHFYIHSRVMQDLVRAGETADRVIGMLDNSTSRMASHVLQENGVSATQFQIALLQVRIKELEGQVAYGAKLMAR